MKAHRALLIPTLAALGLAAAPEAPAQANPLQSGSQSRAAPRLGAPVTAANPRHGIDRRHDGHRHHRHHRHGHWHGHFGLFFGAPLAWSAWHWGWPYYDPFFYPHPRVVYREVERFPEPIPAETTRIEPNAPGAPTQGPLYMNYCESAKAYFPKVTTCPEGWRTTSPTQ